MFYGMIAKNNRIKARGVPSKIGTGIFSVNRVIERAMGRVYNDVSALRIPFNEYRPGVYAGRGANCAPKAAVTPAAPKRPL